MIHLISYGDDMYKLAKIRLYNEAKNCGWFDTIKIYGPEDLDNSFIEKYKTILNQKRGGGYWIWKTEIIEKRLNEINDNDILIYLDAGCSINIHGKKRFDEYIKMIGESNKGIISFQSHHIEKKYTINEIFKYFNVEKNNEIINTGQIQSTVRIMKKNTHLKLSTPLNI